uniref:Uracil phosphoribosyltransferase n=1 Tax=Sheathia arcuata TaxID=340433 RepID=A0A3G1I8X9_9FLOR|nr:uracil phosphoribosyltransferase [Sheathia arcuata]ART65398.1 uracil phosphoribosyltransferase [Sheathia arcuata]
MNLNIYTINHPSISSLISYIYNTKINIVEKRNILNQIYFALLYEATRKSIKLLNLYINKLNFISEIALLPKEISYIILSEIYISYILSKNIYDIIPKAIILPFDLDLVKNNQDPKIIRPNKLHLFKSNSQIFIIQQNLNADIIFKILNSSILNKVPIKQVQVICIFCSIDTLQQISQKYINLNIYTTKIIRGNNNYSVNYSEDY